MNNPSATTESRVRELTFEECVAVSGGDYSLGDYIEVGIALVASTIAIGVFVYEEVTGTGTTTGAPCVSPNPLNP